MRDAVIVEAVRTPVGKGRPNGSLAHVHPVELLAHTLRTLVERTGIDPALIDDVVGGTVDQVGEQAMNTTRYAALSAGFPESVPATTVDRQCGSSQQAVHFAAQGVMAGAYDIVVACGVESMSRVPMWSNVPAGKDPFGPGVAERYPEGLVPQGISAELIAAKWGITRERMDAYAVGSHRKAAKAWDSGLFDAEVAPLDGVTRDESVRPGSTPETLAGLKPAYYDAGFGDRFPQIDWSVTAGNASPINDGASAALIMSGETAVLTGVIPATEKVLRRAGLDLGDIDLFEVNEAFAAVVLAWQQETGADLSKVNVNGGAIAIGHPLGASGTRLTTTLVHAMRARGARYALQTMCEAGGLANAMILEAVRP
ncbi:thiolase family protein [Streptomyces sp. NPDC005385]|uniref:thiolase family protein n=1 Tax=Streptomyces sp. NPDC005385 TaxID=3157039 RepID=UPI0033A379DC